MRWKWKLSRNHPWIVRRVLLLREVLKLTQVALAIGGQAFGVAFHVHAARGRGLVTALGCIIIIAAFRAVGSSKRPSMRGVSDTCMSGRASARLLTPADVFWGTGLLCGGAEESCAARGLCTKSALLGDALAPWSCSLASFPLGARVTRLVIEH